MRGNIKRVPARAKGGQDAQQPRSPANQLVLRLVARWNEASKQGNSRDEDEAATLMLESR